MKTPISLLLLVALLFLSSIGFAQKKEEILVLTNIKAVGVNHMNQEAIQAIEYVLPERIDDFQLNTSDNSVSLQLRGLKKGKWLANKGHVVRYDLTEDQVKWTKKIAYQLESINQYAGITIHSGAGKSYCLDNNSGTPLWEIKNGLAFGDAQAKIGMGYKMNQFTGGANTLEGIDLNDGYVLWQREINREYSWNEAFYLDDSTLLIAAAGLHTVFLYDGSGWDYASVTGKKDYTATAVGAGLGIAAGLLTGTFVVPIGHDVVTDIASNVLTDHQHLYFASKDKIVKLNHDGIVQWETLLPDDLTSKSSIFKHGNQLMMINRGYAYIGRQQIPFGAPFVASYDLHTGERLSLKIVSNEKKEFINAYELRGDTLLLLFNNKIIAHSIRDGSMIAELKFNTEQYGVSKNFIGDRVYIIKEGAYLSLPQADATKHYVYTSSGKTLVLNQELTVEGEINYDELYLLYLENNGFKFIAKENQTFILDPAGDKVAEISANSQAQFFENKLYNANERSFLVIDLNDLFKAYMP